MIFLWYLYFFSVRSLSVTIVCCSVLLDSNGKNEITAKVEMKPALSNIFFKVTIQDII